jgi:poly-gamma-glutamate synthesis protein (capsule biosynthesis protein)
MAEELNALRPLCDFLIVSMHWGVEYDHNPTGTQKQLAAFLAEHRVDLIIGHHPHVLQPWESLPRPDGGKTLCFYSLGNFVSAQLTRPTLPTLLGGLMYIKIKKSAGKTSIKELSIEESGIIPVVTHFEGEYRNFTVYPFYEYTGELVERHQRKSTEEELDLSYFNAILQKITKNPGEPWVPKVIMGNPFQNP